MFESRQGQRLSSLRVLWSSSVSWGKFRDNTVTQARAVSFPILSNPLLNLQLQNYHDSWTLKTAILPQVVMNQTTRATCYDSKTEDE